METVNRLKAICISALLTFAASLYGQEQVKVKSNKWNPFYTNEQVEVNYKYSECSLPEWGTREESAYLQFKNLTNKKIKFTWSPTLWYNEKCFNCSGNDPEFTKTIVLMPGQIIEGTCSTDSPAYLKIFGKYLNVIQEGAVRELKNFEFKNTKVESVQ